MTLRNYQLPEKIKDICDSMQPEANQILEFEVLYPGLITGIGLPHETSTGENDEYKLGMHFDYTYGIPVIYGSSVKGVLHSYFREYVGKLHIVQNGENKVLSYAKGESLTEEQQKKLECEIFGSNIDSSDDNDNMPVGNRDIFFDAIPVQAAPQGPPKKTVSPFTPAAYCLTTISVRTTKMYSRTRFPYISFASHPE